MSTASLVLFTLVRGDDMAFRVRIQTEQGAGVDIRGWLFRVTIKTDLAQDDAAAELRLDLGPFAGDPDSDAAGGTFVLLLPSAQTAGLAPGLHHIDVQREYQDTVTTVLRGRVRVVADVTRRDGASVVAEAARATAEAAAPAEPPCAPPCSGGPGGCPGISCTACSPYHLRSSTTEYRP